MKTALRSESASARTQDREDASPNLGACLRQLRFQRRMSIAEVSAVTGIAKSTLSRVENDQLSLTYAKLLQLCKGLQIDIAELFSSGAPQVVVRPSARRTFTVSGQGRPVTVGLQAYNYVCTELAGKRMTPMLGIIQSRTLEETNGLLKHEGEEFTFVLEGRMALHTEFYEPLILDVGGSVYFDSTMGHAYVSIGSTPLKMLCVCTTPEPALPFPSDPATSQTRAAARVVLREPASPRAPREHAGSKPEARAPHKNRRRR
ncbi:MAG TPA: XRE family transcriptional regulator [Steroidobacteraceae bacterium]|nr:XRE family transcriptional regulator [Steroidobacteraceae bacterium]